MTPKDLQPRRVLVFVETTNPFGRSIVEGISQFALEHHWKIDFEQRGQYDPIPQWVMEWDGDGIIARAFNRDSLKMIRACGLPYVELVGIDEMREPDICVDESALAEMVANHFWESGIRHFAFYAIEKVPWTERRAEAFIRNIEARGRSCEAFSMPKSRSRFLSPAWKETYRKPLCDWLRSLPKPVGLFAAIDLHAKKVMEACHEINVRIPEDVAIIGVENDPWFCRLLDPPLSSVDANGREVGYLAAERLGLRIEQPGRHFEQRFVRPSHLTIRKSSDLIAIDDPDILEALRFIRENARFRISVGDVVHRVNISPRSLQRGFKKWIGRTPEKEILRVQLEFAQTLLRDTRLSVSLIAREAGFSSPEYFIRAFRREYSLTPNVFRTQYLFRNRDIQEEFKISDVSDC